MEKFILRIHYAPDRQTVYTVEYPGPDGTPQLSFEVIDGLNALRLTLILNDVVNNIVIEPR